MLDKFLEPKFVISVALLSISSICLFRFPESNQHVVLGVGIVSGVGVFSTAGRGWTHAALIPGVAYA